MAEFNTKMINGGSAASAYNVQSKKKGQSLTGKCAALVKEQRARIYILRRCATMLCCWYIQGED